MCRGLIMTDRIEDAQAIAALLEAQGWTGALVDTYDEFDDGIITYRFDIWRNLE